MMTFKRYLLGLSLIFASNTVFGVTYLCDQTRLAQAALTQGNLISNYKPLRTYSLGRLQDTMTVQAQQWVTERVQEYYRQVTTLPSFTMFRVNHGMCQSNPILRNGRPAPRTEMVPIQIVVFPAQAYSDQVYFREDSSNPIPPGVFDRFPQQMTVNGFDVRNLTQQLAKERATIPVFPLAGSVFSFRDADLRHQHAVELNRYLQLRNAVSNLIDPNIYPRMLVDENSGPFLVQNLWIPLSELIEIQRTQESLRPTGKVIANGAQLLAHIRPGSYAVHQRNLNANLNFMGTHRNLFNNTTPSTGPIFLGEIGISNFGKIAEFAVRGCVPNSRQVTDFPLFPAEINQMIGRLYNERLRTAQAPNASARSQLSGSELNFFFDEDSSALRERCANQSRSGARSLPTEIYNELDDLMYGHANDLTVSASSMILGQIARYEHHPVSQVAFASQMRSTVDGFEQGRSSWVPCRRQRRGRSTRWCRARVNRYQCLKGIRESLQDVGLLPPGIIQDPNDRGGSSSAYELASQIRPLAYRVGLGILDTTAVFRSDVQCVVQNNIDLRAPSLFLDGRLIQLLPQNSIQVYANGPHGHVETCASNSPYANACEYMSDRRNRIDQSTGISLAAGYSRNDRDDITVSDAIAEAQTISDEEMYNSYNQCNVATNRRTNDRDLVGAFIFTDGPSSLSNAKSLDQVFLEWISRQN